MLVDDGTYPQAKSDFVSFCCWMVLRHLVWMVWRLQVLELACFLIELGFFGKLAVEDVDFCRPFFL